MIIQCFSSEDFGPKRLIYNMSRREQVFAAFDLTPEEHTPETETPAEKRRLATRITGGQRGELAERRREQSGVTPEEERKMIARLGTKSMLDEIGDYYDKRKNEGYAASEGWRKWNKAYYPEYDKKEAKEKIKVMQLAIFTKLEILGRPGADIDGKIGPFTLLAMAVITKRRRSGVATEAIENNPNYKKVFEIADATVLELDAIVLKPDEISEEEKEEKEKAKEKKERKRKKVAKIEGEIEKKKKEIYRKSSEVYRHYAEAAKNKKIIEETSDIKAFHVQQKEAEEKAEKAKDRVAELKSERDTLEEKRDVVRYGPEYVAKSRSEKVEKEIKKLWLKFRAQHAERRELENEVAGLSGPQWQKDLDEKNAQIEQTKNELSKKENEAVALKKEIAQLSKKRVA